MTRLDKGKRPPADARSGRNKAGREITPMEAVLARDNVERLHEVAERRAEPVRMEGLPAGRRPDTTIQPGAGSLPLVGSMRRSIPAPYRRDRISIDHHGREWAYRRADQVRPGDMVVDVGRVDEVFVKTVYDCVGRRKRVPVGVRIGLVNPLGEATIFDPADQVRVFALAGS